MKRAHANLALAPRDCAGDGKIERHAAIHDFKAKRLAHVPLFAALAVTGWC